MTAIPNLTRRADSAAESLGLTPYSITATASTVLVQPAPCDWTVTQAEAVVRAFGAVPAVGNRWIPDRNGEGGFTTVTGVVDGIQCTVHARYEPAGVDDVLDQRDKWVIVTVDCPECGHDKALSATVTGRAETPFACQECTHLWWGEVVEPDVCGLGLRGPATCGLPPGHDEPCRTTS